MGRPIVQKIVPSVANAGLLIDVWGHNLSESTIRVSNGTSWFDVSIETDGEKKVSFLLPTNMDVGDYSVMAYTPDGDSGNVSLRIVSDPMLGFEYKIAERSVSSLAEQITKMQPRGKAWNTNPESTWQKLLFSICDEIARGRQKADFLRAEMIPSLSDTLIDVQEKEYGLPEECNAIVATTLDERKKELVRKFAATGGMTSVYFKRILSLIGIDAEITEESEKFPFLVGSSHVGDRIWGTVWLFTWYVTVYNYEINVFKVGVNTVGTPLRWWGNIAVECLFEMLKPAHTNVVVRYESESSDEDWYDVDDDIDTDAYDVDDDIDIDAYEVY